MTEPADIRTAIERNVKAVTLRPSVGQGTAVTRVRLGESLSCEITEGPWTLSAGMTGKYGGDGSAPNPGVLGRAAFGSCLAIGYAMWAARLGVSITSLEIDVQADYDVRGELGVVRQQALQNAQALPALDRQREHLEAAVRASDLQYQAGRRSLLQLIDQRDRRFAAEQRQVVAEFSKLLVRTYSNALASLKDLDVQVRDSRKNGNDVTVRTQMVGRAKPVAIDYSLINTPAGWKVYDVTVEGISLIAAYRDEFGTLVSSSGISGLIDVLKKKNGN